MKSMNDAIGDLARLKGMIAESDFDIVVAASPENVLYTSDAFISTQVDIRDRLALVVWDGSRAPSFILCAVEEAYARQESWISDIRTFKEFVTSPIDLLAELLREMGAERGHIGLEMEYLGAAYFNQLAAALPDARFSAAEALFDRVRMHKTAREREIMAAGFRGTEKALKEAYEATRAGETERDMCYRLTEGILRSGAESVAFNHINAGPNTGFPHKDPADYVIQAGDILKADAGGRYRRYYSNVGRTAKLGPLSDEDRSWWGRLRDIHREIIDLVRPGNTGRQLFEKATALHERHGIPFPYAHNGHGIGLFIHEHPLISPHDEIAYEAGMMTTVETRVRWPDEKGYHMEDLIEVTEGAPVGRSDYFDNEEILVV